MKKIEHETVQKILDAADIVEVVSDFVHLKRRGANYIGLCPFHNERTPSFSVSKSKGICKCFSCGKGGSPVNFIMELEQMSYNEALRYLAKKYNIEIKEHEMTDAERQAENERESMMAVNEFAGRHFATNLTDTEDGRLIGLSYFRERGINDLMIKRFHLGYAIDKSDDLYNAAISKGFSEKYLVETGLCIKNDAGRVYDRFKGRVIYPVHSVSGKVIAFGGRTLRKDKNVAKYVNSPESAIYKKSNQLYGLYQAKQSIVKQNKCILVEGYMDVISMHQSGVENVVASSGTSLTEGQIRLIHRFTDNVTVIYDSDAAGIKASLRGIDMLLAEGMNIKVLLLPEGDDPDSYAQSHTTEELENYIKENETDFIRFKTNILLTGAANDPIARSNVISDIVRSISVIPNEITRSVYVKECSRALDIEERVLSLQLAKEIAKRAEAAHNKAQQDQARRDIEQLDSESDQGESADTHKQDSNLRVCSAKSLYAYEREILKYVLKYGMVEIAVSLDDSGETTPMKLIDYVIDELDVDDIKFTNPAFAHVFEHAVKVSRGTWDADYSAKQLELNRRYEEAMEQGREEIRRASVDLAGINEREKLLKEKCDNQYYESLREYAAGYIERILLSVPDDQVRNVTGDLVSERYKLSNIYTKTTRVYTEQERLEELVVRAIYELKYHILLISIKDIHEQIKIETASNNQAAVASLMKQLIEFSEIKRALAKYLGERIVTP